MVLVNLHFFKGWILYPSRWKGILVIGLEREVGIFYKKSKINPSTKTFQALRVTVNNELENLKIALREIVSCLKKDGILAVVSFQSCEDKIVKKTFLDFEKKGFAKRVNKKVIKAQERELLENKRARSAKLRLIKKIN